jgi:hypothetical protein
MSGRDLEQLRQRLQDIHLESEALHLEEEALLARIAIVERQVQPPQVHNNPIARPLAIGDRVRILNPGPGRRQPRDIVGVIIHRTAHFVTVRTDSNFIIRRAPHNVEHDDRIRVVL